MNGSEVNLCIYKCIYIYFKNTKGITSSYVPETGTIKT
jgi:hypothetical protein